MWIWLGVTLAAAFGIFAPSIFGMDGMDGGFALSFVCLLVAITGVVVVFMYRSRAAALDKMLQQQDVLAHWQYSPQEWQRYTEKAFELEKKGKWALFGMVMVIAVVVLVIFWIAVPDSGWVAIGVFVGLAVILSLTIFLTTNYTRWQNTKHHGEVYIARDGAYINRQLHLWRGWGADLEKVSYDSRERIITITYSIPSRQGRDTHSIYILVPQGRDGEVKPLISALGESHQASL
jgi:hypothetical protein